MGKLSYSLLTCQLRFFTFLLSFLCAFAKNVAFECSHKVNFNNFCKLSVSTVLQIQAKSNQNYLNFAKIQGKYNKKFKNVILNNAFRKNNNRIYPLLNYLYPLWSKESFWFIFRSLNFSQS